MDPYNPYFTPVGNYGVPPGQSTNPYGVPPGQPPNPYGFGSLADPYYPPAGNYGVPLGQPTASGYGPEPSMGYAPSIHGSTGSYGPAFSPSYTDSVGTGYTPPLVSPYSSSGSYDSYGSASGYNYPSDPSFPSVTSGPYGSGSGYEYGAQMAMALPPSLSLPDLYASIPAAETHAPVSEAQSVKVDPGKKKGSGSGILSKLNLGSKKMAELSTIASSSFNRMLKTEHIEKYLDAPIHSWEDPALRDTEDFVRQNCTQFDSRHIPHLFYRFKSFALPENEFLLENMSSLMSKPRCYHFTLPESSIFHNEPMITLAQFIQMLPISARYPSSPSCLFPALQQTDPYGVQTTSLVGGNPVARLDHLRASTILHSLFDLFAIPSSKGPATASIVTFSSWAVAVHAMVKLSSEHKLSFLWEFLMDPGQQAVTPFSLVVKCQWLSSLMLSSPTAKRKVTPSDADHFLQRIFPGAQSQAVLADGPSPVPPFFPLNRDAFFSQLYQVVAKDSDLWPIVADGFGLFPYWHFKFLEPIQRIFSEDRIRDSDPLPYKEGFLQKNVGGNWKNQYFILNSAFLYSYPPNNDYKKIVRNLWVGDVSLNVSKSSSAHHPFCFEINMSPGDGGPPYHRKFSCLSEEERDEWVYCIQYSSRNSPDRRLPSFATQHYPINGKWFIDGKDMYAAVLRELELAREQIFITDWFISPEVYLLRENPNTGLLQLTLDQRLDRVLQRKANDGVQIFILPWRETEAVVPLASANAKSVFERLSKNIFVICHPVFTLRWSHHQKTIICDQNVAFVGGLDLCFGRWDTPDHAITDNGAIKIFPGKDYYNPAIEGFADLSRYEVDMFDRAQHPRMPWHDVHLMVDGGAARDIANNFILRWNSHIQDLSLDGYPVLIPKTSTPIFISQRKIDDAIRAFKYLPSVSNSPYHMDGNNDSSFANACHLDMDSGLLVHPLRSIGFWSGFCSRELSIHAAYLNAIKEAQHFIYIENQYFISSLPGVVENTIALALTNKLIEAHRKRQKFKVIVLVPLFPEGDPNDPTLLNLIFLQNSTIKIGDHSIEARFHKACPDGRISDYISFHTIRNYAQLGNNLVYSQIYVHTKLMIVDDRIVICGSANINDRSMLGNRDSEIALEIRQQSLCGTELLQSSFNGTPTIVSRFAHRLRCYLWMEHLGMDSNSPSSFAAVSDPLQDITWNLWKSTSSCNSQIFDEVFGVNNWSVQLLPNYLERLRTIRGHLCDYSFTFKSQQEVTCCSINQSGLQSMAEMREIFT